MKERNFLLIGQSHSVHFSSLINYLDNFLEKLEEKNKNIIYNIYILPSYPYDWGIEENIYKKKNYKVLNIPVRKDIYEKTNIIKKLRIFRRKLFFLIPEFIKEKIIKDKSQINLINWDASVRKIFSSKYPCEINPLKSEIRLYKDAIPHRFKHSLDLSKNNLILNTKFHAIWLIDALSAGYLFEDIKSYLDTSGKIFLTTYGNDFFWFSNNKKHKIKLINLLKKVDYVQNETKRDNEILKSLNYRGNVFEPCHATFKTIESLEKNTKAFKKNKEFEFVIQGSNRLIDKNFVHTSLNSISKILLKNFSSCNKYKIAIFRSKKEDIDFWNSICGAEINFVDYGPWISQNELFNLFGNSRFFIHPTMTDGVSNCCLEATFLDCLPITSPNNGFSELIIPELKNLLITKNEDPFNFDYLIEKLISLEENEIKNKINILKCEIKNYINEDKYQIILNKIFN